MKIAELRKEKGISRAGLERMAGLKPRSLENYEHGIRRQNGMALDTAIKIADALGVDPRMLLEDDE